MRCPCSAVQILPLTTSRMIPRAAFSKSDPQHCAASLHTAAANPLREATDIGLNTFVYLSLTFALLKGQAAAV